MPPILAESNESTIIFWLLVLIVLVFIGLYAVLRLRRWLREADAGPASGGFTLADLRELHRRGDITTEQYEKARAQMLAAGKAMTAGIDPLARPGTSAPRRKPPSSTNDRTTPPRP